jgi:hypothetical protein
MKFQKVLLIMLLLVAVCIEGCKKDEDPAIRPTVTSTDPVNKGVNIAVNSSIAVTFSVAMNPSTITTSSFTVVQGTNAISGAIAYAGTTATFNPAVNLATATLYTQRPPM